MAQFVKQPSVFNCDDRLGGKVLYQFDLLVGERAHFLSVHVNRANELTFLEHWHTNMGPYATDFDKANDGLSFRDVRLIVSEISDVDDLFAFGDAIERDSWVVAQIDHRIALQKFFVAFLALNCDGAEGITFEEQKEAVRGLTDTDCIGQ